MNNITNNIIKFIQNPRSIVSVMGRLGWLDNLSEKKYAELLWWSKTGKKLDLESPKGFNEKLQWLKVYDHRPEYTKLVDKYLVREFVKEKIGDKYLVPLIGVWENADEIDFALLPDAFVLKCNHNSGGGMCVCKEKTQLNIKKTRARLNKALKLNYYKSNREWPYKNVEPKILCEQFIVDNDPNNTAGTLIDYKFHCFNGEPKFLYVGVDDISSGTKGDLKLSFFDLDWNISPFYRADHQPIPVDVKAPECLGEMIRIARKLSEGIPFVRVDLYWVNNQILFSELTFYPGAGFGFFSPDEWELKLGDWLELPQKS